MTDPWGSPSGYPASAGQPFQPFSGTTSPGGYNPATYGAAPPGYEQVAPDAYGGSPNAYGASSGKPVADFSWRRLWPLVSLTVAGCGIALALVPPPAGWVGVVAGVFGIIAAVIGWIRRETARNESALPTALGAGLSVLAIVVAVVMSFVYGEPAVAGPATANSQAEAKVDIGEFEIIPSKSRDGIGDTRLKVSVSNVGSRPTQFSVVIGAFEGSTNNQIWWDRDVVVLAAGATQQIQMFKGLRGDDGLAETIKGADFRIIGIEGIQGR